MILRINKLFAYSANTNKCFYREIEDGLTIIHGRNTSGKSTFFQMILYTFGINDCNKNLKEILDEEVISRLDISIKNGDDIRNLIIVRDDEIISIYEDGDRLINLYAVGSDNSAEHIKLKEFYAELFNYNLKLLSNTKIVLSPIEVMFLPYYISQSTGWVYLRKSFTNLEFYKDFKESYLDYYLGITNGIDKEEFYRIKNEISNLNSEIVFLDKQKNSCEMKIAKEVEDKLKIKSEEPLIELRKIDEEISKNEKALVDKSNYLFLMNSRKNVLNKSISNFNKYNKEDQTICTICGSSKIKSLEDTYIYFQQKNDLKNEKHICSKELKKHSLEINRITKKLSILKEELHKKNEIINRIHHMDLTLETLIDVKSDAKLERKINDRIAVLTSEKITLMEELKGLKSEEQLQKDRTNKSKQFMSYFRKYLEEFKLNINMLNEGHGIYQITSFTYQGTELHLPVLAHNFAFNKIIKSTPLIHRFPFMIDSIFNEDLDQDSEEMILKFLNSNRPLDTQMFISIADIKGGKRDIPALNSKYFKGEANIINIGNSEKKRSFLSEDSFSFKEMILETENLFDN